jgi:predicted Zn-dependent protease
MSRHPISLVAALMLAGCAGAPRVQDTLPAPTPIVLPETASTLDTSRDDARLAVRNLVSVVDAVEPIAEAICRDRAPDLNCDFAFAVDRNPNAPPNAFQTLGPDGRPIVAFTVALLAEARNVDEMAFILSHEAAHHIEGHLARQRRNATIGAAIMGQVVGLSDDPDVGRRAAEFGAAIGARTYSKDFELEADALGTVIAAQAGYDPVRGAAFFFRIPDPGDTFLGTHPANADRVRIVQRTAARLGV